MLPNRRFHGWIRHRKGEIVEGHEDDIRATFYILAFQREFNDEEAELRWKVVDMMVVGGKIIRLEIRHAWLVRRLIAPFQNWLIVPHPLLLPSLYSL